MNHDEAAAVFGIIGGFPGDEELLCELRSCGEAFQSPSANKPPLGKLVSLLEALPRKGRDAMVRKYLASSPHRDAILRDLYDYCFDDNDEDMVMKGADDDASIVDEEEVDEFVLIGNPHATGGPAAESTPLLPLNLKKFHIFQVVILLMAVSGPAGADMSRRYLNKSCSTKYRAKILVQCVACYSKELFTDDELWEQYQMSPRLVQNRVVNACKHFQKKRPRKDFLRRVYEQDNTRHRDLLYSLDTEYVANKLEATIDVGKGKSFALEFKFWGALGDLYASFFQRKMAECQQNKLKLGAVWKDLAERICFRSVQERHLAALIKMWEDFEPYHFKDDTLEDARIFLSNLAEQGEDVSTFSEVQPYDLHTGLLGRLSKKNQLELALKYFQARQWSKFDMIQRQCPHVRRHQLPYKEILGKVNAGVVWPDSNTGDHVDPFLGYFWTDALYADAGLIREKSEVLQAWSDMLMRCKPSDLPVSDKSQQRCKWRRWYYEYFLFFRKMSFFFQANSRKTARLQADAAHVQMVLKLAVGAYSLVSTHLGPPLAATPILELMRKIPIKQYALSEAGGAQRAARSCIQILAQTVVPAFSQSVQFDPTDSKTYVSPMSLNKFYDTVVAVLSDWGASPVVLESVASAVVDLSARASDGLDGKKFVVKVEEEQTPPARKRHKIVYYSYHLHREALTKCTELAKRCLAVVIGGDNDPVDIDSDTTDKLWCLVRQRVMAAKTLEKYLDACVRYLPKRMRAGEQDTILTLSRTNILSFFNSAPHKWTEEVDFVARQLQELSLLENVLEDKNLPVVVRDTLLIAHAGYANENARQSLKDATYVADGVSRAIGIRTLLTEACSTRSLDLIADALDFSECRIKNEAGSNRKIVFEWLQGYFVSDIVLPSLREDSVDLGAVKKLCSAIISIFRNDISRLDSVGGSVCFPTQWLPSNILTSVVYFDPVLQRLEVRRLWVNCSIRLHWEFQAASSGAQSLSTCSWPLQSQELTVGGMKSYLESFDDSNQKELGSAIWISEDAFETLYPPYDKTRSPQDFGSVVRKGLDITKIFGPAQCVHMLASGLGEVWSDDIPTPPLLPKGRFPETEKVANALRVRIESLFYIAGPSWQEVELLKNMFDNVFADLENAPTSHFRQACKFLHIFWEIHRDVGAVEVPRIVEACDKAFKVAVAMNLTDIALDLLYIWTTIFLGRGRRQWDVDVDDRMKSFVHRHCQGCEPKAWRLAMTKTDLIQRQCNLTSELLTISSSALLRNSVISTLFERRQDVLMRYLDKACDLRGVFRSDKETRETIDEVLFENVKKEHLFHCQANVTRRYAQYSLAKATSRSDLGSRISAIWEFMDSPSTQPADVLAALQSSVLEDAIREALINRVFSLDSPWHVLGFLLSQKVIKKDDQRATSSLLGYVARHIPVDKVVLLVGHLLKKIRRNRLGVQLHKAVVRMLFDARTNKALELLRKEWDSNLHDSVRVLFIEECMERVLAGKVDSWEVSVLMDAAAKESIDAELKLCLFAPSWRGINGEAFGFLTIKNPEDVLADGTLEMFRKNNHKRGEFDMVVVAEVLSSVLAKLEVSSEGILFHLARIKRLSFSNLFGPMVSDSQGALAEMMRVITQPVECVDHIVQVERRLMSEMFAYGAIRLIKEQLSLRPGMPQKEVKDQCNRLAVVSQLRACVRSQIDAILDLPVRKHLQRAVHLDSLQCMFNTVASFVRDQGLQEHNLHQLLVVDPYAKELAILMKDKSNLLSALQSTGSQYHE